MTTPGIRPNRRWDVIVNMRAAVECLPEARVFETSLEELSELELLALHLGPGQPRKRAFQQALRLVEAAGSLEGLKDADYRALRSAGLSHRRALAWTAGLVLFERLGRQRLRRGRPFRSSMEIFRHFQPLMERLRKECFWSLLLDGKNRMLQLLRVSEGSLTSSPAHPREVFRPAVQVAAAAVIFVHNHPSGDPTPSQEDIQLTRRLAETGKILGIRALDHVIIGDDSYFSFADQNMI